MIMSYFLDEKFSEKFSTSMVFFTKFFEISYFSSWRIIDFSEQLYLRTYLPLAALRAKKFSDTWMIYLLQDLEVGEKWKKKTAAASVAPATLVTAFNKSNSFQILRKSMLLQQ